MNEFAKIVFAAAFGAGTTVLGIVVAGKQQADLWRQDALYKLRVEYLGKRAEAYRSMSAVLYEGRRLKLFHGTTDGKGSPVLVNLLYCASAQGTSKDCALNLSDESTKQLA